MWLSTHSAFVQLTHPSRIAAGSEMVQGRKGSRTYPVYLTFLHIDLFSLTQATITLGATYLPYLGTVVGTWLMGADWA